MWLTRPRRRAPAGDALFRSLADLPGATVGQDELGQRIEFEHSSGVKITATTFPCDAKQRSSRSRLGMADPSALVYTIDLAAGCRPGVEHVDVAVAKQLKRALANLSFVCGASGEMRQTTLFIAVTNCGRFRRLAANAPMDERAASLLCEYFPIFQRGCSPEDAASAVLAEYETAVETLATVREVRLIRVGDDEEEGEGGAQAAAAPHAPPQDGDDASAAPGAVSSRVSDPGMLRSRVVEQVVANVATAQNARIDEVRRRPFITLP